MDQFLDETQTKWLQFHSAAAQSRHFTAPNSPRIRHIFAGRRRRLGIPTDVPGGFLENVVEWPESRRENTADVAGETRRRRPIKMASTLPDGLGYVMRSVSDVDGSALLDGEDAARGKWPSAAADANSEASLLSDTSDCAR